MQPLQTKSPSLTTAVIETGSAFTKPENIDPGQKAPFEITVGTNDVMGGDLSIIDHYAIQASS